MTDTERTQASAATVTRATERVLAAITRAENDLAEARRRLANGQRPAAGLTGCILGQSASDVDSASERLNTILDMSGLLGLTEADLTVALALGTS